MWWAIRRAFIGFFLPFMALGAFAWSLVDAHTKTTEAAAVVVVHSVEQQETSDGRQNIYHLKVRAASGRIFDLHSSDEDLDLPEGQRVVLDLSTSNGQVEHLRTETRSVGFEWQNNPDFWLFSLAVLSLMWIAAALGLEPEADDHGYWALGIAMSAVAAVAVVSPFFLL